MANDVSFVVSMIDDFSKNFDKLEDRTKNVLGIATKLGAGMTAAGAMGAAGMVAMTKAAGDFDQDMRSVNTMAQLSEDQFASMKDEVLDLSKRVPESAGKLAEGLYGVVSAGVPAEEQMRFLETSAQAAAAGISETGTVVNAAAGLIKNYGLEFGDAEAVTDKMFTTVKLGTTTFDELASSVGGVAPLASEMGVSMDELMATYATLTGVTGNTSEITTQLKGALSNVLKPSSQAAELAEELGLEFNAAALESQGLAGFLDSVTEATGGSSEKLSTLFGSTEGLQAILALTGEQADDFSTKLDEMTGSAGAMNDAFGEQMKALGPQWDMLKNNIMSVVVALGTHFLPYAIQAAEWISNLISRVMEVNPNIIAMAAAVMAGVTAFLLIAGPILMVIGLAPTLIGGFTAIATALGVTAGALAVTIGWVALIGVAIVALAVLIYKNWDSIKAFTAKTWGAIRNVVSSYIDAMKNVIRIGIDFFKNTFSNGLSFLKALVKGDFAGMKDAVSSQMTNIRDTIKRLMNNALDFLKNINLFNVGKDIIQGLLNGITNMTGKLFSKASEIANGIKDKIKGALNINSPSRVMMELGEFTGEGLTKGLSNSIASITQAAGAMAGAAVPEMPNTRNSRNQESSVSNNTSNVYYTINVDGNIDRDLYDETQRRMAREANMKLRVRGKKQ
jgi:TP901 family phage tail tape measure protein